MCFLYGSAYRVAKYNNTFMLYYSMKLPCFWVAVLFLVLPDAVGVQAEEHFGSASGDPSAYTNLVSFFPDVRLVDLHEQTASNQFGCLLNILVHDGAHDSSAKPPKGYTPQVCLVSLVNHSTNYYGTLRMPATNLCRIELLDRHGSSVPRTPVGKMYGLPLSQPQIEAWRLHWDNRHERMLMRILPSDTPEFPDIATDFCSFGLADAFEIKEAGEYELHVQTRLVQVARASSGMSYYPVDWLPEGVVRFQVFPENILSTDSTTNRGMNSATK